jgi:hypothetical protein
MSDEIYKTFNLHLRGQDGRWVVDITKVDGSQFFVDLPGSSGARYSLTTDPPTYAPDAAIKLATDAIEGGTIRSGPEAKRG